MIAIRMDELVSNRHESLLWVGLTNPTSLSQGVKRENNYGNVRLYISSDNPGCVGITLL